MSIASYNQEQEKMMRHKIGDHLYDLLTIFENTKRDKHGMDTSIKRPSKMELSSLPENELQPGIRTKNAKQEPGNNLTTHSRRGKKTARRKGKKPITKKRPPPDTAYLDYKAS